MDGVFGGWPAPRGPSECAGLVEFPPLGSSGAVRSPRSLLGGEGDNDATGEVFEKTAPPTWSRGRAVPGFALHFWRHAEDAWVILRTSVLCPPTASKRLVLRSATSLLFSQHFCFDLIDVAELELRGLHNSFLLQLQPFHVFVRVLCLHVYMCAQCKCLRPAEIRRRPIPLKRVTHVSCHMRAGN